MSYVCFVVLLLRNKLFTPKFILRNDLFDTQRKTYFGIDLHVSEFHFSRVRGIDRHAPVAFLGKYDIRENRCVVIEIRIVDNQRLRMSFIPSVISVGGNFDVPVVIQQGFVPVET